MSLSLGSRTGGTKQHYNVKILSHCIISEFVMNNNQIFNDTIYVNKCNLFATR